MTYITGTFRLLLLVVVLFPIVGTAATLLEKALDEREAGNAEAIASQKRIDALANEADSLLQEYRTTLHQIADLRVYNQQLQRLRANQKNDRASLERRLAGVSVANRRVLPLVLHMIEVLEQFLERDFPFLPEERKSRVQNLKQLMERSDVSLQEKYRRVLEAYQIEADYGLSIEAYQGEKRLNGKSQVVDFLRIGRLALFYASLDRNETGYWDPSQARWKPLPKDYNQAVHLGLSIARKEIPPDFIPLPIATPLRPSG
ncbi:MAG: DUF3450 domain-containing protein [Gammaproteobacteria bacterium]